MLLLTLASMVSITIMPTLFLPPVIEAKVPNFLLRDSDQGIPPSVGSRIVDGVEAKPYEFPWLVEIRLNHAHVCGGSILNTHYILTAAHCVNRQNIDFIKVVANEHNMRCREGSEVARKVVGVTIHEDYNSVTKWNDIATLRVDPPWVYTNKMGPGILSPKNLIYPATAVVPGWGLLHHEPPDRREYMVRPDKLRKVELPHVSDSDCQGQHGSYMNATVNVCYGGGGDKDSCSGDSGGPLMCKGVRGRDVICGVVSWGYKCTIQDSPGIYVKVPNFLDWIKLHSNISHPAPPTRTSCSGYLNASQGFFNFTDLADFSLCTWTIESYYEEKLFTIVSSFLVPGDEIWFTNVSHVCKDCRPLKIDPRFPGRTYKFGGSSIIIMTIRLVSATKLLQIKFTSSGDRATRYPVTNVYTSQKKKDYILYPEPPEQMTGDPYYYYNSQNALFVLSPGVDKIKLSFILMDIRNGGGDTSCPGDHLAVFHLSLAGKYNLLGKYCGKDISPTLDINIEGPVILQFVSTPDSKFGEGFILKCV